MLRSSRLSRPAMRERLYIRKEAKVTQGITPAYAGKTNKITFRKWCDRDHPRVCGKDHLPHRLSFLQPGSPPRMRERLKRRHPGLRRTGITPAYAGKTLDSLIYSFRYGDHTVHNQRHHPILIYSFRYGDHPRVCGKDKLF